jgi:hypothetical protein
MNRSNQFLAKLKATSTGKLLDSLPRNIAVAILCFGTFNVTYCHDREWKLPTPSLNKEANIRQTHPNTFTTAHTTITHFIYSNR